jgi:hypothetical protein
LRDGVADRAHRHPRQQELSLAVRCKTLVRFRAMRAQADA